MFYKSFFFTSLFACLLAFSGTALAHTKLKASNPENGAELEAAPTSIVLEYSGKIRLTKASLKNSEKTINLDLGQNKKPAKRFVLRSPLSGSGQYTLKWRGLGADGHVIKGSFGFVVP